jgi:hypothetical protein
MRELMACHDFIACDDVIARTTVRTNEIWNRPDAIGGYFKVVLFNVFNP